MSRTRSENVANKLRAAGKWQEFCDFRISEEAREGISTSVSYNRAISKFNLYLIDPEATEPGEDGKPADVPLPIFCTLYKEDFLDKRAVSEKEAIDWAIANVGFRALKPKEAPSPTAWMYVIQFRQNGDFLRDCLKKRVPNISKAEQDGERIDDGRKQFNLLDKLLTEQGQSGSAGMVRNNDGVLQPTLSGPNQT